MITKQKMMLDVETAFLNGYADRDLYMTRPDGYYTNGPNKVLKIIKSLYGLKQAPRAWYQRLDSHLLKMRFTRCPSRMV